MNLWMRVFACAVMVVGNVVGKEEVPSVRLLLGFEKEELEKWGVKGKEGGFPFRRGICRKGDATQGEYAFVRKVSNYFIRTGKEHYNLLRRNGYVFHTWGWFRGHLPEDWSGHGKLRMEVKSKDAAGRLRVEIEDELCSPLLRRVYHIPRGKWVTVEFDLEKAAELHEIPLDEKGKKRFGVDVLKARVLNPRKMANIYVYFEQLDGPTTVFLDNIRLVNGKEKNSYPVIVDERPFPHPLPLSSSLPEKRKTKTGKAISDIKQIRIHEFPKTGVGKTCYARISGITRRAFAVTAEGDRMLFGFLAGYVHVFQTLDGGTTWTGLDGKSRPTRCYHSANAPSHCAAAAGPDLLYVHTDYCAGGAQPSNMFFRCVKHAESGWTLGSPHLVDVDCRHCPEFKVRVLRLASGRIWAAWMHLDRFKKVWVRARYSDDGGITWRDPDSNALMLINRDNSGGAQRYGVTLWVESPEGVTPPLERANGRVGVMAHNYSNIVLTPYGGHVACIWCKGWHPDTMWAYFDGEKWSKPQRIAVNGGRVKCVGAPGTAVTVGRRKIYVSIPKMKKVLRLEQGTWREDTPPGCRGGVLSVSGETLFCIGTRREGDTVKVLVWRKPVGGEWKPPLEIARENLPLKGKKRRGLGVAAPQYGPGGFLPVAWGPHHAWMKWTKVPELD